MSTVYLDRSNLQIDVTGGALKIAPAPRGRGSIPLAMISRLVLRGRVEINSSALGRLAENGIAVICLAGRNHRRVAQLVGINGNDAIRRIHQFAVATDPNRRLVIARRIINAKIEATSRELQGLMSRRPAKRLSLIKVSRTLQVIDSQTDQASLDSLLGLEGAAAAAWFRALASALPASLKFTGRNRRPPRDPVNATLSLAYTLLHSEAVAAIHGHGFDPMLGFLHEPAHGRESLACDLIEPLRPRVDGRVLDLFCSQQLHGDHFASNGQGCRLTKTGRHHFYSWWESIAATYRRYLRANGHALVRVLAELAP